MYHTLLLPGRRQLHDTGITAAIAQTLTDGLSINTGKAFITDHPPATVVGNLHDPLSGIISTKQTNQRTTNLNYRNETKSMNGYNFMI